jgi:hypothetical protein
MYKLQQTGNQVFAIWTPANEQITLKKKAKTMARQAVQPPAKLEDQTLSAKATAMCLAKQKHQQKPIEKVGEYTKKFDTALLGKHTRLLNNVFRYTEADILAQLRTGMSRVNGYLYRIDATNTDLCACGQAKETVEHFLFHGTRWDQYREIMLRHTTTKKGNLSYFLGGKAASDTSS